MILTKSKDITHKECDLDILKCDPPNVELTTIFRSFLSLGMYVSYFSFFFALFFYHNAESPIIHCLYIVRCIIVYLIIFSS